VWDVIGSCEITGSADSSIRDARPNDIAPLLAAADIRQIYTNGQTAHKYYNRYLRDTLGCEAICLPSTSPANAAWSVEKLVEAWGVIRENL